MIETHLEEHLAILRLNRPDKANALTRGMLETLPRAVSDVADAKVLVLTGTGKVFCAGMDLDEAHSGLATDPVWEAVSSAIAGFQGLTIAALNGTAAGGSLGMVLACDLRVAVPRSNLFYPVMKFGFLPQPSDPARLRALVGPARAKWILMAGQKVTAQTALDWGLIDALSEVPIAEARRLAADVLAAEPGHVAAIKRMIG